MSEAYSAGYTAATTPHYTTIPAEYNLVESSEWIDGFCDGLQVRLDAAMRRGACGGGDDMNDRDMN